MPSHNSTRTTIYQLSKLAKNSNASKQSSAAYSHYQIITEKIKEKSTLDSVGLSSYSRKLSAQKYEQPPKTETENYPPQHYDRPPSNVSDEQLPIATQPQQSYEEPPPKEKEPANKYGQIQQEYQPPQNKNQYPAEEEYQPPQADIQEQINQKREEFPLENKQPSQEMDPSTLNKHPIKVPALPLPTQTLQPYEKERSLLDVYDYNKKHREVVIV
jgi:hypothetical protein